MAKHLKTDNENENEINNDIVNDDTNYWKFNLNNILKVHFKIFNYHFYIKSK